LHGEGTSAEGSGGSFDRERKTRLAEGRLGQKKSSRSSAVVEQNLFQDQDLEYDFAPPKGPVVVGLEELIQISAQKCAKPKLADRRIQILGKRLPKFIPPVWKSAAQKLEQKRKNEIEEKEEFNRKMLRILGSEVKESRVAESGKGDKHVGKFE
jgi:hypothetical protein